MSAILKKKKKTVPFGSFYHLNFEMNCILPEVGKQYFYKPFTILFFVLTHFLFFLLSEVSKV